MTLQTRPRLTDARRAAPSTSWPEPPRAAPIEQTRATCVDGEPSRVVRVMRVVDEAELVGASGCVAPPTAQPRGTALSPGLARLLNAALVDPAFGEQFMESPEVAARQAVGVPGASGELFGTTLPDPALRLTLPALSESEWAILARMPRTPSLAAAARELRRLVALDLEASLSATSAAIQEVADAPIQTAAPVRLPVGAHSVWSPASHEGALAGAA